MENKFLVKIKPRFADTDGMSHVNNAKFVTYLEIARSDWFLGNFPEYDVKDFDFILAHISIDFKAPITIKSRVIVEMQVTRIGVSSWDFEYTLSDSNSNSIYASAKSVQVSYDYHSGKSKPLPDKIIPLLKKIKK